jgi:hypothetical protein
MIQLFKRVDPDCYKFLDLKILKLRVTWFTDCGEWFIYINWGIKWWIRFNHEGCLSSNDIN